ncbi:MAG: cyclic pyranopterin monophosphate synthase MoaC [Bacteroidota bacterium]
MTPSSSEFTHLDAAGNPNMVDVGGKAVTFRQAQAQALVRLTPEILAQFEGEEIQTKKGPVFQTAIIAGTMAVKRTHELIPLCHPLAVEKIKLDIQMNEAQLVEVNCTVGLHGKTGVEMEALTGATVAALTIYDMCKAFSHDIELLSTRLMAKSGGKRDFQRT